MDGGVEPPPPPVQGNEHTLSSVSPPHAEPWVSELGNIRATVSGVGVPPQCDMGGGLRGSEPVLWALLPYLLPGLPFPLLLEFLDLSQREGVLVLV